MYTYAALVDIGVFENQNDDRVLLAGDVYAEATVTGRMEQDWILTAVCDGVGGMAKGYRAAEITLEFMKHLNRPNVESETVCKAIEEANRRVRLAQENEQGMCTTIAGVYADGERFFVFNAGDSRVYRLRYKYLTQLSKDHSLVQDMIELGEISKEEAWNHSKKNVINKCIGYEENVNPRVVDLTGDFQKGDVLLLCSDGITDYVAENALRELLFMHRNEEELGVCCRNIYEAAVAAGTQDNMSVILLRREG